MALRNSKNNFSKLINKNRNSPRLLFTSTDRLINPISTCPSDFFSITKRSEFAVHFNDKSIIIRKNINQTVSQNTLESTTHIKEIHCTLLLQWIQKIISKVVSVLNPLPVHLILYRPLFYKLFLIVFLRNY